MKTRIFLIIFLTILFVVSGSAFLVYSQLHTVQGINLKDLENKLYSENTDILTWSLKILDVDSIGKNPLPASWAEILIVNNDSLTIGSSSNKDHTGLAMYAVPELMDQANGILETIKSGKPGTVSTETYIVSILPLGNNRSLLGFKPRSWEKAILDEQNALLNKNKGSIITILVIYGTTGLLLAIAAAFFVSSIVIKPTQKVVSSFEELSMGNFDAEIPRYGGKAFVSLADSFFRLKTSLMIALERLGGK